MNRFSCICNVAKINSRFQIHTSCVSDARSPVAGFPSHVTHVRSNISNMGSSQVIFPKGKNLKGSRIGTFTSGSGRGIMSRRSPYKCSSEVRNRFKLPFNDQKKKLYSRRVSDTEFGASRIESDNYIKQNWKVFY